MSDRQPMRILVVDDEASVAAAIAQWLGLAGHEVRRAASVADALREVRPFDPDVVLSDVRMPGRDGLELLADLQRIDPDLSVVLLTGHGDVPMAVAALKAGAADFLLKPHDPERLLVTLENAGERRRLRRKVTSLSARLDSSDPIQRLLIGSSRPMQQLRAQVRELAALPVDVVVVGETGTGKEVVARALHEAGTGHGQPFVGVNCAAIPRDMFESEVFGHEAGAFTGAKAARIGKIEHARSGTVLLDEIESMPLEAQAKLLRVLQERTMERLGSNKAIAVGARFVAATKVDLRQEADAGRFRADLYYRLAAAEIAIPPLRARGDDVVLLFEILAAERARSLNRPPPALGPALLAQIRGRDWPGNVRELKLAADRHAMGLAALPIPIHAHIEGTATLPEMMDALERQLIEGALRTAQGSLAAAAEALGVPRRTLNDKILRHGIVRSGAAKEEM